MLYNLWGEEGVCIFVNIPKAAELHEINGVVCEL